jgi:hypothetical protein
VAVSFHVTASSAAGDLNLTGSAPVIQTPRLVATGLGVLILEGFSPATVQLSGLVQLVDLSFGAPRLSGITLTVPQLEDILMEVP